MPHPPPRAAAVFRSPIGVAVCRHSFAEPKLLLFVDELDLRVVALQLHYSI